MKKIPLYFLRGSDGRALKKVAHGMEDIESGAGVATEKVDGSACAIIEGRYYKRYDANTKRGRKPPLGGIPCQPEPDPHTGHWPFWVLVDERKREDQWFVNAYKNTPWCRKDGTYEAVGKHFNGNPYGLDDDFMETHGRIEIKDFPRTYDLIKEYFEAHDSIEGVVFWVDGKPKAKIRRKDFGLPWPAKGKNGE